MTASPATNATRPPATDERLAHPPIVGREEWLAARRRLLAREKELTRLQDAVSAARRRLPMVRVEKDYVFQGPRGPARLTDLFDGRRQLIVYHFMFDPDDPPAGQSGAPWTEGCPGCSFFVDNLPHLSHLRAAGTNLALVSRAPLAKIAPFKARMGWSVPWYSSFGSDFNYDFHATIDPDVAPVEYNYKDLETLQREGLDYHLKGEQHGLSVFLRLGDQVFHTYSTYGRGVEPALATYHLLDWTPYGRQEDWEDSPPGWPQQPTYPGWVRHHDRYDDRATPAPCCGQGAARA